MGQKVCPTSFRIGITEDWRSRWYADKKHFGEYVVEDEKIRRFIKLNYHFAGIPKIEIERTRDKLVVFIFAARPGLLIGRKGAEVDKLKSELEGLTSRMVEVSVEEVQRPELSAQLVAEEVAQQLKRRSSFRQTLRRTAEMTMDAGAKGVKILISGRLGGSELARREKKILGSIPLHTLTARVDYGFAEAQTKYGTIGVKAWINLGLLAPGEKMTGGAKNAANA
jgi:small subunit ribosomal protein S3